MNAYLTKPQGSAANTDVTFGNFVGNTFTSDQTTFVDNLKE